jgi:transposase
MEDPDLPSTSSHPAVTSLPPQLPNDVESLKAIVQQLHESLEQARQRNQKLEHQLEQLLKWRFGPRADRLDPNQLTLFATELLEKVEPPAPAPQPKTAPSQRNGHGRRPLPKELARQQVVHDLSEEEKRCPCCGEMRVRIGEQTSEQLEFEPSKLYVLEHVRPTYACRKCEGNVQTASKPLQPIEKGVAGPGLLAQVITCKYGDHLPLYRQEAILGRSGQSIPRSTTCGWLASCASLVRPLYDLMRTLILMSKVVHTDDTPVPVLDPQRGRTREGRIWVYVGDRNHPYTVFDYTPTHCRDGPSQFFGDYAGYIQADGYSGYDHLFKPRRDGAPRPREVGCWAHTRRKFVEAETSDGLRAHTMAAMIKRLYDVEHEATERIQQEGLALDSREPATAAAAWARGTAIRFELRQQKSAPQLAVIKTWLDEQQDRILPKSPIGLAIGYCVGNWVALERYLQDGDLSPDNNAAENAIRPIVLGRKNWLFAGSDNGGRTGAVLASLVASCKRHQVDPCVYLKDMLTRIAATPVSQLDQFLPDRWKAARIPTTVH